MSNVTPLTAYERERFALWLETNPGGTFDDYIDHQIDTTPADRGGAA